MPVILLRSNKPRELMNVTRCIDRSFNRNNVGVEAAIGPIQGSYRETSPRFQGGGSAVFLIILNCLLNGYRTYILY